MKKTTNLQWQLNNTTEIRKCQEIFANIFAKTSKKRTDFSQYAFSNRSYNLQVGN